MWTLLLLSACAAKVSFDSPLPPDGGLPYEPATGDELARYEAAAAYSEAHRGRAFVVVKGDAIVYQSGQNGHALDAPHHLFSGTKTFSCLLMAAADADGHLQPDDRVRKVLPELPKEARRLTVDQLLHLTSGVSHDFLRLSVDGMRARPRVDDKAAIALSQPWRHDPGERFAYGATHFFLFGEVIERSVGLDPVDYLQQRVFEPIGFRTAGWIRDPSGTPALSYGAFTTAAEWAEIGVLLRDDGMFRGQRVLPEGLFAGCAQGSEANPAYGRAAWLNRDVDRDTVDLVAVRRLEPTGPIVSNDAPSDLLVAAGHDDQRLYVIPSLDLVIARLGDGGWSFTDRELLAPFLASPTMP